MPRPGAARLLLESVQGRPLSALAELLADDAEWWVAGDPSRLPWAGSFAGPGGFRTFLQRLDEHLDYQHFQILETVDGGHLMVQIIDAGGVCRTSGRPFKTVIARTFEEREGRIVRVRSLYDTAAYERALQPPDA